MPRRVMIRGCALVFCVVGCRGVDAPAARPDRLRHVMSFASEGPALDSSVPREFPYRLEDEPGLWNDLERRTVSLTLDRVPLEELLREVAAASKLQLVSNPEVVRDLSVTLRSSRLSLPDLLDHLEAVFPIRLHRDGSLLRVEAAEGPRMSLLVYPLPGGLVEAKLPVDFESIRQLSFISRSQREEGATELIVEEPGEEERGERSHLEGFLLELERLVPWPEGSHWFLDRRRNLLLIRSTPATLDMASSCLDRLTQPPVTVEIETRFLELSEGFFHDLGVEMRLTDTFPLKRDGSGGTKVGIGEASATRFGLPLPVPGEASGLDLSVVGILSEPQFRALLHAFERDERGEVLSAPAVTTLNNSRATIAVTTNLPFVEDYRPVFDTTVVSSDGISTSDANVALVAVINDRNFTGIVLNVTPSVGSDRDRIHLRLQPVVRDQVDAITISNGALVEGVTTPAITRPIIETRFIDTQLAIPSGATVALGGLQTTLWRTEQHGVPILSHIPFLGLLFRREVEVRERRDLVVLVTARIDDLSGPEPLR